MQFPPCFLSQLHSSTHTTGLFLCTKCILRTDRRMKPVLLKVLRSPLWRSLRSTVKKYVVLSLKSGRNLYIHETLAELLGEGCSDAGSLINKQIHVSYLRRDTFENDGRILLSLRIAGEDWITLKDTTNAFREHIKAPIYTVALTIAVLWVSYLSICVFSGVRKYMRLHRKRTKKRGKTGFIRKADSVSASAARVSMHHPENRENTAQRQPGSVDFFTRLVILVFPPA